MIRLLMKLINQLRFTSLLKRRIKMEDKSYDVM